MSYLLDLPEKEEDEVERAQINNFDTLWGETGGANREREKRKKNHTMLHFIICGACCEPALQPRQSAAVRECVCVHGYVCVCDDCCCCVNADGSAVVSWEQRQGWAHTLTGGGGVRSLIA